MHVSKLKKIIPIQNKIESIDKEIQALNDTVSRIHSFERDAIINMQIHVSNPDDVPESTNISMTINDQADFEKFRSKLNDLNNYLSKQTSLSYDLTETDLLIIFAALLKNKQENRKLLINQLLELGVTYELPESKTKRPKKARQES